MSAKSKILLIEDDVGLATVYRARLEAEGFEVHHADDGEKAMDETKKFQPDLILLDLMMPKVDGFTVLDLLKKDPQTRHCKVIVLSALGQPQDVQRAKELGADDYLIKSEIIIAEVMERVRRQLGVDHGKA